MKEIRIAQMRGLVLHGWYSDENNGEYFAEFPQDMAITDVDTMERLFMVNRGTATELSALRDLSVVGILLGGNFGRAFWAAMGTTVAHGRTILELIPHEYQWVPALVRIGIPFESLPDPFESLPDRVRTEVGHADRIVSEELDGCAWQAYACATEVLHGVGGGSAVYRLSDIPRRALAELVPLPTDRPCYHDAAMREMWRRVRWAIK